MAQSAVNTVMRELHVLTVFAEALLQFIERYVGDEFISHEGLCDVFHHNSPDNEVFHSWVLKQTLIARHNPPQQSYRARRGWTDKILALEICHHPAIDILG